jgi:hypothetical protein
VNPVPSQLLFDITPAAAAQVYESLVKQLEPSPEAIQQQQQQAAAAAAAAVAADPAAAAAAAAAVAPLGPAGGPITALPSDQAGLVWIQYMRFCRRSESVTASRKVRRGCGRVRVCPLLSCVSCPCALATWMGVCRPVC